MYRLLARLSAGVFLIAILLTAVMTYPLILYINTGVLSQHKANKMVCLHSVSISPSMA